jgi:hypothetical protein
MLLASCGSTSHHSIRTAPPVTTVGSPAASALRGFVASYPSSTSPVSAYFIQWQRTGNSLTGTLENTSASAQSGSQGSTSNLSGSISGQNIVLNLSGEFDQRWNGVLNGNTLTLSYPSSDGSIGTIVFTAGTVDDYNQLVAKVKGAGYAEAGQEARARARAQAAQNAAQARQTLASDAATVNDDLSSLAGKQASISADLTQVTNDLKQMRADLATEYQDLKKVLVDSPANVCNDNYQVSGNDAYQVNSNDDYQITSNDEYTITNDFQALSDQITQLETDQQKVIVDQSTTTYAPPQMSSPETVAQAASSAQAVLTRARSAWNTDLETVKQLDKQATAYGSQADAACNRAGGG